MTAPPACVLVAAVLLLAVPRFGVVRSFLLVKAPFVRETSVANPRTTSLSSLSLSLSLSSPSAAPNHRPPRLLLGLTTSTAARSRPRPPPPPPSWVVMEAAASGASSFSTTSNSANDPPPPPPPYDGNALARDVLGNNPDYFYYGGGTKLADAVRDVRDQALGSQTVNEVRRKWRNHPQGYSYFASTIAANPDRVVAYFLNSECSVETLLDELQLVTIGYGAQKEHELFQTRGGGPIRVPTLDGMMMPKATTEQDETEAVGVSGDARTPRNHRHSPLCLVTGSSGSGKTYFCLHYLRRFGWDDGAHRQPPIPRATLYLYPNELPWGDANLGGTTVIERIVLALRRQLQRHVNDPSNIGGGVSRYADDARRAAAPQFVVDTTLNMHLTVIFDEAGNLTWDGLFDDKESLHDLCAKLREGLAESVSVVVSGTGISGARLHPNIDGALVVRMVPWNPVDLVLLTKQLFRVSKDANMRARADDNAMVEQLVLTAMAQPKLRSLLTNARCAYFLLQDLIDLCSCLPFPEAWTYAQIDAWSLAISTLVLRNYVATNSIQGLELVDRPVVSACVFQALEDAEAAWYDGGENARQVSSSAQLYTNPPAFQMLSGRTLAVARALVTWNLEVVTRGNGNNDAEGRLGLVEGEHRPLSVTPAISMVLFVMSGIMVPLIRGCNGAHGVAAAMYVARQRILECHQRNRAKNWRVHRDELGKINLVEIRTPIVPLRGLRAAQAKEKEGQGHDHVLVPLVSGDTILLSGDKASFADVIAPYLLVRVKRASGNVVKVDMVKELGRCCLLKSCEDKLLLRGLLAVWRGDVGREVDRYPTSFLEAPPRDAAYPADTSSAYPENQVRYGEPVDPVKYGHIPRGGKSILFGEPSQPLMDVPDFDDKEVITLIISTNARAISIQNPRSRSRMRTFRYRSSDDSDGDEADDEGRPYDGSAEAEAKPTARLFPSSFLLTPKMLTKDLQLDTSRLNSSQGKAWAALVRNVSPKVTIKFLFTAMSSRQQHDASHACSSERAS